MGGQGGLWSPRLHRGLLPEEIGPIDPEKLASLRKRLDAIHAARIEREARQFVRVPVSYDEVHAISEMLKAAAEDPDHWAGCEPAGDATPPPDGAS